jgi:hypothetical protein
LTQPPPSCCHCCCDLCTAAEGALRIFAAAVGIAAVTCLCCFLQCLLLLQGMQPVMGPQCHLLLLATTWRLWVLVLLLWGLLVLVLLPCVMHMVCCWTGPSCMWGCLPSAGPVSSWIITAAADRGGRQQYTKGVISTIPRRSRHAYRSTPSSPCRETARLYNIAGRVNAQCCYLIHNIPPVLGAPHSSPTTSRRPTCCVEASSVLLSASAAAGWLRAAAADESRQPAAEIRGQLRRVAAAVLLPQLQNLGTC